MDKKWTWAFGILALPALIWALAPYASVIHKTPAETYILSFSLKDLIFLGIVFYGVFLLPGLLFLAWRSRPEMPGRFFESRRVLLALALGCTAHVVAIFIQKFLHLPYRAWVVLPSLASAYAFLFFLLRHHPQVDRLLGQETPVPGGAERWLGSALWILALILGWEMTLRGRASSVNLIGDGYPHLINLLGTMEDGPLPDGLPFYSTFILNIHPMAFHALWADLKVLTPGLLYIDLFRYFSVLMIPVFLACMMAFFSYLAKSRLVGAMGVLAALFISGGGLSLKVPIAYYPWYWAIAWCLAAAVFYLLLKGGLSSRSVAFWAGLVFGVGILIHPFFAIRMASILVFFLPLEILRRVLQKEAVLSLLGSAGAFALAAVLPVGLWILPMVLRHGWELTYPYAFIVEHFQSVAPAGVAYIQKFREVHFSLSDLFFWSRGNAGLFPLCLAPLGIWAALRQGKNAASSLLLGWLLAMAAMVLVDFLPNRYRYFEFLFYAELALAVYGLGYLLQVLPVPARAWVVAAGLVLLWVSIRLDFIPKYQYTLALYGRTSLTEAEVQRAEARVGHYLQTKREGKLDQSYGNYTGYLWSRQRKIWDIYVGNQQAKKSKEP